MNKRVADKLHKRGVASGRIVAFYHPGPKPPAPPVPEVVEPNVSVGDILRELLEHSEDILEAVVLTKAKDGRANMISTFEGPGEALLFMKQVEHSMIRGLTVVDDSGEGPRPA